MKTHITWVIWMVFVGVPVIAGDTTPAVSSDLEDLTGVSAERLGSLTLSEIIGLALENNPATRASWNDAKAAAARHRMETADYWPSLTADVNAQRSRALSSPDRPTTPQNTWSAAAGLSWLLVDFGGREGAVARTDQLRIAAELTHEGNIQDIILQVATAYFRYMSMKALRDAERINSAEAEANLEAARRRHGVGLATIADVLQAEAAESRARLNLQRIEGELQITRGALALSMGLPANIPYDIEAFPGDIDMDQVLLTVDQYIAEALEKRPDFAAAKARVEAAGQNVREVRAKGLPSIKLTGSMGRMYYPDLDAVDDNYSDYYSGGLSLHVPLFTGFSSLYETRQAQRQVDAETARRDQLEQRIVFQVFSAYYSLQTASQQVKTSRDLLTSASKSEEVSLARYKEGVGTIIDLLSAQSVLADARSQDVQSRWAWFTALAQLIHDTGSMRAEFGKEIVTGIEPSARPFPQRSSSNELE